MLCKKRVNAVKVLLVLIVCCGVLFPFKMPAADSRGEDEVISAAAEVVFQSMSKAEYQLLWSGLTVKTHKSIIQSVRKALAKGRHDYTEEQIRADFARGGELARGYWTAYLSQFYPKTILEESRWSMGKVQKDRAEIIIRHKKSDHDAILKMYREDGSWKVGLDETFYTRQLLK